MAGDRFHFTITDLARFLGKAPVTLRRWEAKGDVVLPRPGGGDRKLNPSEVRGVAWRAFELKRITKARARLIDAIMTMLELIEK